MANTEIDLSLALPWAREEDSNEQINLYDANGEWVALLPHQCVASIEAEQRVRAAFILRAVNSHADLLAALEELVVNANRLCDRQLGGTYEDDCRRSIAVARAAMKKAEA